MLDQGHRVRLGPGLGLVASGRGPWFALVRPVGCPDSGPGQFIPGSSGTTVPLERTWWTMPPGSTISTSGMPGVSSKAWTVPAGRLAPPTAGRRLPARRVLRRRVPAPDVVPFSAAVGVGQGVEEREGRPHRLGDGLGGGKVGERAPDVGLEPFAELRKSPHRPPICLATLGSCPARGRPGPPPG